MIPMQETGAPIYGKFKIFPYNENELIVGQITYLIIDIVLRPLEQDFTLFRGKTVFDITDRQDEKR